VNQTHEREHPRATAVRDDRVLPVTRWVSALIVPFLLAAFIILYLFPDHTQALFAWGIQPRMSAMVLASAYLAGAYFFVRAATLARWHLIHVGFLPVTTFATLMGIATILHWNRFNHGYLSFFVWVALYFTTPFIVLLVWLLNRSADPAPGALPEQQVPQLARLAIGLLGGVTLVIALVLFLLPGFAISIWPWALTPLTARTVGALVAIPGMGALAVARDSRWSAARIALQSLLIALVAIALAMIFSWGNFNRANPLTWLLLAGLLFLLVADPLLYWWMETRGSGGAAAPTQS
jgi:hypothetical protein